MLSLFLSFLSISQNTTGLYDSSQDYSIDRGCGNDPSDIFFINTYEDINMIKSCNFINGSLFINGDYNIDTLEDLSNIEYISGYLVIYDSHTLKSLKGFHNLKYIHSINPYLLNYGVTIKYNDNINDNSSGLCFSNRVNWNNLTSRDISISNNRIDCPNCHFECNGCFGPSRFLCQNCYNYKSGNACVSECPNGTLLDNNNCIEFYPNETINLNFNRMINENKLSISWDEPNNPNGYVIRYILFRDGNELLNTYYNTDGYYTNESLNKNYIDTLGSLDTNYEYKIAYSNSIGSFISDPQNYLLLNRVPYNIYNLEYRNLTNTSVILNWFYNNSLLTPIFELSFNNSEYIEIENLTKNNETYTLTLGDLTNNTDYFLSIRAKYESYFTGNESNIFFRTLNYFINNTLDNNPDITPTDPNNPDSTPNNPDNVPNNPDNVPDNPDNVPDNDEYLAYWYLFVIGSLLLFGLLLCCIISYCNSSNENSDNSQSNSQYNEENTTRVYDNPIYEDQESKYGDESTYGDVPYNQRNVIVNSNYNYVDNIETHSIETNSMEYSLPTRKITKRRSFGKLNDTLQRKDNLMDEIRERVPDMVPKNMLSD